MDEDMKPVTLLGKVCGTMDDDKYSEDAAVWVKLADGVNMDDVVGCDVYMVKQED